MKNSRILLVCCLLLANSVTGVHAWFGLGTLKKWLFPSYDEQDPATVIKELQRQQVNNPFDPALNYNLGIANCKIGKFEEAKNNFDLAIKYAGSDQNLVDKAIFNRANSGYHLALSILPAGWQTKKISEKKLDRALDEVTQSIDFYQQFLAAHENHEQALLNKAHAEELRDQLRAKKQQQQQEKEQKNQDNKDQQEDQDSDQDDQQQDNDQQGNNGQQSDKNQKKQKNNKKDQQQKQQNSNNGKDGQKEDSENGDDSQEQDQQEPSSKNQKDQKEQQEDQQSSDDSDKEEDGSDEEKQSKKDSQQQDQKDQEDEREGDGKDGVDGKEKDSADRDDKKLNNDQGKNEQHQDDQHTSSPSDLQNETSALEPTADDEKNQQDSAAANALQQEGESDKKETAERRAFRALLSNLEENEAALRKKKLAHQLKQVSPRESSQRPW